MTVRIINGDALEQLRELPDGSVRCCVTSPPYYLLRNYGVPGQIGLEATPSDFIDALVAVFTETRRVLSNDGSLWLNLGDSYATNGSRTGNSKVTVRGSVGTVTGYRQRPIGFKAKDLMMMPARVAIALQESGWYLRSVIIWHKPNPMPEAVKDRPTTSHEYVYLLTSSERYYFDQAAVMEPVSDNTHARISQDLASQIGSERANGGSRKDRPMKAVFTSPKTAANDEGVKNNQSFSDATALLVTERNTRTVWTIPSEPFKGAHFATFPSELARRCILAGSARGDTVLDPFGGAGTTGLVADRLGRHAILIELNPTYAAMAERRIHNDAPLFSPTEEAPS